MKPNPELPFFVYGHLQQGELAHFQISNLVKECVPGVVVEGFDLAVVDGVPFAVSDPGGRVTGQVLKFSDIDIALRRIENFEEVPHLYSWSQALTSHGEVNLLVSHSNQFRTRHDKLDSWSGADDPYLGHLIPWSHKILLPIIRAGKHSIAPARTQEQFESFLVLQSVFQMLWTLLERVILFREGRQVFESQGRWGAVERISFWQDTFEKARIDKQIGFRENRNSLGGHDHVYRVGNGPLKAWSVARNNMVHRGKSAGNEVGSLIVATKDLHNVLAIALQNSSESIKAEWIELTNLSGDLYSDELFILKENYE